MELGAGLPTGADGGGSRFDNGQAGPDRAPGSDRAPGNEGASSSPALVLDQATKSFGAVRALEDGSIELYAGEVHALVGENGAGKSTLMRILAGVYSPDRGSLKLDGAPVLLKSPRATRRGSRRTPNLVNTADTCASMACLSTRRALRRGCLPMKTFSATVRSGNKVGSW